MPVRIPSTLPARSILTGENIFVMGNTRAETQDIRPLQVAILNLMPTKIKTETQLLRLLGNSALQVEITLLQTATYQPTHTAADHLLKHYQTWDDVRSQKFDGLVITGAPLGHLAYEQIEYWDELCAIMDWAETNVYATLYICWAAHAAFYYHYGLSTRKNQKKVFGVYEHRVLARNEKLLRGFDDVFYAPHSRHASVWADDIRRVNDLKLLAESDQAGAYLATSKDGRKIFVMGHSEYDPLTLKEEYERDIAKGLNIEIPGNYFPQDDPTKPPEVRWRGHANLLYANWLNYYVYQVTPYNIADIPTASTDTD
ncbi:MAG TPA: homoserine O-succinyltransferase, partial [Anaerolineales bacterium]|nr:homoserine O-succinyltransferase [Anaerolineales bacterium]